MGNALQNVPVDGLLIKNLLSRTHLHQQQAYLQPGDGPIMLCIAPTRELAVQIKEECDKFGGTSGIKNTCVYGTIY
jgi:superfamily II DNA/RNA helicase